MALVLYLHRTKKLNDLKEDPEPQGTLQPWQHLDFSLARPQAENPVLQLPSL